MSVVARGIVPLALGTDTVDAGEGAGIGGSREDLCSGGGERRGD